MGANSFHLPLLTSGSQTPKSDCDTTERNRKTKQPLPPPFPPPVSRRNSSRSETRGTIHKVNKILDEQIVEKPDIPNLVSQRRRRLASVIIKDEDPQDKKAVNTEGYIEMGTPLNEKQFEIQISWNHVVDLLRNCYMFSSLSVAKIVALMEEMEVEMWDEGEIILNPGDTVSKLLFVYSGKVNTTERIDPSVSKISLAYPKGSTRVKSKKKRTKSNDRYAKLPEVITLVKGPGSCIAELEFLEKSRTDCTAVCAQNQTVLLRLDIDIFIAHLRSSSSDRVPTELVNSQPISYLCSTSNTPKSVSRRSTFQEIILRNVSMSISDTSSSSGSLTETDESVSSTRPTSSPFPFPSNSQIPLSYENASNRNSSRRSILQERLGHNRPSLFINPNDPNYNIEDESNDDESRDEFGELLTPNGIFIDKPLHNPGNTPRYNTKGTWDSIKLLRRARTRAHTLGFSQKLLRRVRERRKELQSKIAINSVVQSEIIGDLPQDNDTTTQHNPQLPDSKTEKILSKILFSLY